MSILGLLKKAHATFASGRARNMPPPPRAQIEVLSDCFTIRRTDNDADTISFDAIRELAVYKADLLTIDLICCQIRTGAIGGPVLFTVDEDMPGFDGLMRRFETLPGFDRDWHGKVVQPPFATNWTVIFQVTNNTHRASIL